ncbi:flagellar biosynthesis protein FliQ [Rheinheimera faecalis]|jgi:flagellar biosynthetic protein FliQ|uniref:flagellar biosynthesis protein FliQ n=1 Tax=Rheinheimera faecalis TaxID=2901141 RepID=UPI001E5C6583|nr:flagellar biosynthesis protein FliQ [Rheinheimera faecalis]
MDSGFALNAMSEMFELSLKIALPLLLSTLAVGILVSVIQVVTQIQEMTLTFVPKIFVALFVLAMLGHWMLGSLMEYSKSIFAGIASM